MVRLLKHFTVINLIVLYILIISTAGVGAAPKPCDKCKKGLVPCRFDCSCYDPAFRCDGTFDCYDESDEYDCDHQFDDVCQGFTCSKSKKCVMPAQLCDHVHDCGDGDTSDEDRKHGCDTHCNSEEFTCKNGQCISLHSYCDGITNCGDGSDEVSCPKYQVCNKGESPCRDGTCIMADWYCDGDPDCTDFSDEEDCSTRKGHCTAGQFQCESTKRCISKQQRCDKQADCVDASDEAGCDDDQDRCRPDQFVCNNGECIEIFDVCNGLPDCSDSSDEKPSLHCTSRAPYNSTLCSVNNGNCEHQCRYTKKGFPECICEKGFRIAHDRFSCVDIDECTVKGSCSQNCTNSMGSFICRCEAGYSLLGDGTTCKAEEPAADLLITDRKEIKRIITKQSRYKSILKNLTNAIGLDYDINRDLVYWTDVGLDKIMRSYINGSDPQEIISMGLETPSGIALDWIHELLFWADSGTRRIEVADLNGNNRKVLIWDGLEKPRSVAVHPQQSYIFWLDWGALPRLERAAMDGGSRITLATRDLKWPNGLTIDYVANTIYWTDAKYHRIERVNLDGSGRQVIVSRGLPHPFGISVFEDYIYWTDWETKTVNRANKFTGDTAESIARNFYLPMSIASFHPLRQKSGSNRCARAECSHLCLPTPRAFTCACPTGFAKINDTHCEEEIDRFLIFAADKNIRRISMVDDKKLDVVLPIKNMKAVVGLDWHANYPGILFWTDISSHQIYRSDWDGRNQKVIVSSSLDSPCGIAVDWTTEKLYWTDAGNNRIEVALLDGAMRTILIHTDLDKPRGIAVHPESGRIVFTDWGARPRIEVAGMDGRDRQTIVSSRITWPNDVTIDHTTGRVYWTDAVENMIESCRLDGSDRRVLVSSDIHSPFGITCDEDNIYWTDWTLKSIIAVNKITGENRRVIQDNIDKLMDVRYFHNDRPQVPNPCSLKNAGCSHLCLLSMNLNEERNMSRMPYTCACPSGLTLRADQKTCSSKMESYLAISRRSDIRIISLDVPYSVDVKLNIENIEDVVDVAIDPIEDTIYFTDIGSKTIQKFSMNVYATKKTETIIEHGLENVEGIAVDPFSKLIYWTDFGLKWIGVSKLDGSSQRILISDNIFSPRAIALHHSKGLMFWSDWAKEPGARIERAQMDGSDRRVIVKTGLVWPNGVSVDRENDKIFWCDANTEKIESSNLLGGNRKILKEDVNHAYSISYQNGMVYWTDWKTCDVRCLEVDLPKNCKVIRRNMPSLMGISASTHFEREPSQCANNPCSHLCLPTSSGFVCSCPTGVILSDDGITCKDMPDQYLIFTTHNAIRRLSLDTDDHIDVILPLQNLKNTVALDYHYRYQKLFFTDIERGVMVSSFLNASKPKVITADKVIRTAEGLAVDWIADNLYWTDTHFNSISVSRLDGTGRKTIVSEALDEPRAIAVHPTVGLMFWTDWGKLGKIERSYLDGSNRTVIIIDAIGWPNGLTIDYQNSRIFWVDAKDKYDHIESCDLDGSNRRVVLRNVPHGFSLSALKGHLYWTDWTTSNVHTVTKGGKIVTLYTSEKHQLMDIKAVSSVRQTGTNVCAPENGSGGCRYMCLMRGPNHHACVLPDDISGDVNPYLHATTSSTTITSTTTTTTTIAATPPTTQTQPTTTTSAKIELRRISTLPPTTTAVVRYASSSIDSNSATTTLSTNISASTEETGGGVDISQLVYIAVIAFVCVAGLVGFVGCLLLRRGKKKDSGDAIIYFQNPTYSINNPQVVHLLNNGSANPPVRDSEDEEQDTEADTLRSEEEIEKKAEILNQSDPALNSTDDDEVEASDNGLLEPTKKQQIENIT